jgi:DNA-binding MarR family transcriptional regulator
MSGASALTPPVEHGRKAGKLGEIEGRLGYRLHRTDLLAMQLMRDHLSDIGLTPARATALAYVRAHPGAGQSDLARALDINRASAMEMVNQLVRIGAIERREGRNQRTNALHLTAEGDDLYNRFIAITFEIDSQISADLSPEEVVMFERLLSRINTTLRASLEPITEE